MEESFGGVLKGLYEFFKFNLCSYNIFKIKNIVIIALIYHSLKNYSFRKFKRFLHFPSYFPLPQSPSFPSPPNSQTKPKKTKIINPIQTLNLKDLNKKKSKPNIKLTQERPKYNLSLKFQFLLSTEYPLFTKILKLILAQVTIFLDELQSFLILPTFSHLQRIIYNVGSGSYNVLALPALFVLI